MLEDIIMGIITAAHRQGKRSIIGPADLLCLDALNRLIKEYDGDLLGDGEVSVIDDNLVWVPKRPIC
jgi:hypothetical protein